MAANRPSMTEKARITADCQRFIDEILKPRFLPAINPTPFNYCVDIQGKWHGPRYRFIQRYRSGFPENLGEEFDAPFVRLYRNQPLVQALKTIDDDGLLHPL